MWTFLGRIAKLLEDITVFLQLVTPDESSPIRHELKEVVRPRSRTVSHSSMAVHPRLCRTSTGISSITGKVMKLSKQDILKNMDYVYL